MKFTKHIRGIINNAVREKKEHFAEKIEKKTVNSHIPDSMSLTESEIDRFVNWYYTGTNCELLANENSYRASDGYWAFRPIRFGGKAGTISFCFSRDGVPDDIVTILEKMVNRMCSSCHASNSETGSIHSFGCVSNSSHYRNEIGQGLSAMGVSCNLDKVGPGFFVPFDAKRYSNWKKSFSLVEAVTLLFRHLENEWEPNLADPSRYMAARRKPGRYWERINKKSPHHRDGHSAASGSVSVKMSAPLG